MDIHARWMSSLVKSVQQYDIDQWMGQNEYIYGKSKEELHANKIQEANAQVRYMHQTDRKRVQWHGMHLFDMLVTNIGAYSG
jgi:hypothetical protein